MRYFDWVMKIISWIVYNQGIILSIVAIIISIISIKQNTKISLFKERYEICTWFSGFIYGWNAFASQSNKYSYWQMFVGICYSLQCQNPSDKSLYLQIYNSHLAMLDKCLLLYKVSPEEIQNLKSCYSAFAPKLFNSNGLELNLPNEVKNQSLECLANAFFDCVKIIEGSGVIKKMERQITIKS